MGKKKIYQRAYLGAFTGIVRKIKGRVIYFQVCVINTDTLRTEKFFYSKYLFK